MNKAFLKNMKLFKLVEYNHSCNKVIKLIKELDNNEVTEVSAINILGDTPTTKTLIKDLKIDKNYICLFDYLFISSQMSAKPYFIGSTGILLLW